MKTRFRLAQRFIAPVAAFTACLAVPLCLGGGAVQAEISRTAPQEAATEGDLLHLLLTMERDYAANQVRAEQKFGNKPLTFRTFVSEIKRQDNRPLIRSGVVYFWLNSAYVGADIFLDGAQLPAVNSLNPGDLIEVQAYVVSRAVRSKDRFTISGSVSPVYGSNGNVYGGGGSISGGTVTTSWPEFTFDRASIKVVATFEQLRQRALQDAELQARLQADLQAKQQERLSRAKREYDVAVLRREIPRQRWLADLTPLCMAADPSAPNYGKARELWRFVVGHATVFPDRYVEEWRKMFDDVVRYRRAALLEDIMGHDHIDVNDVFRQMTVLDAMFSLYSGRAQEMGQVQERPIELDAEDVELFRVVLRHPRAREMKRDKFARNLFTDSTRVWVKNEHYQALVDLFNSTR